MKTLVDIIKQKPYLDIQDASICNYEVGEFVEEYLEKLEELNGPYRIMRFVGLLETVCSASFQAGKDHVFEELKKLV